MVTIQSFHTRIKRLSFECTAHVIPTLKRAKKQQSVGKVMVFWNAYDIISTMTIT